MSKLIDIVMPDGDEETGKNVLASWLAAEGDTIKKDDPIIEISTDKVNMEIAAPESGILTEILVQEGTEIRFGDTLGKIQSSNDVKTAKKAVDSPEPVQEEKIKIPSKKIRLSPVVKKLIEEHQIAIADLIGTGRKGRISKADVLDYLENAKSGETPIKALESKHVPHTPMRKSIADHMVKSLLETAPHVTSVFEMDMSAIIAHKKAHQDKLAAEGVKLTYTAYFLYASLKAIETVPEVNSRYHEDTVEFFSEVNIGMGTALEDKGLIVPVIRNVEKMNLNDMARQLHGMTEKARQGKLTAEDLKGGTFTISNHGVSGSLFATPIIINQPQSAILGIGKMEKRVKVMPVDGIDQILIKPMAYVTLSIDHRVLDAYHTNAFLSKFVDVIENWT